MINYLKEIIDTCKLPIDEMSSTASYTCIGAKAIVINNYLKILSYSNTHIVLKVKDDELVIEGRDITIKELSRKDICITGTIAMVYYAREVKKSEE